MFQVGSYQIRKCASCGHGYVAPMPTVADLDRLYQLESDSLYANGVAGKVADFLDASPDRFLSYYADRLAAIGKSGVDIDGTILDFGCTNGAFVEGLTKAGYRRALGYDIAETLVEQGRKRWKVDLHSGDLREFLQSNPDKFDVIHSVNVLEHLPDPRATLDVLQGSLKPDGALVLSVPNTQSLQVFVAGTRSPIVAPPHHLQYFSPRSFTALVEAFGFRVVSVETPFWGIETDTYLALLGVPRWAGAAIRLGMGLPAAVIRKLRWGGVIRLVAVRR
jgi:SAM-dependent methyltransferase